MPLRIGIFGEVGWGGARAAGTDGLDRLVDEAGAAAADGFPMFWLPQAMGFDVLTVLAVIGRQVPGIGLGTAVVPVYPRHPVALAAQAVTVQEAIGGRLVLGIGLSHQYYVETVWGLRSDRPVRALREYVTALRPLLRGEAVDFRGDTVAATGQLTVGGPNAAPPVLVAALGPQMLRLAGQLADGTVTWMTGPATLAAHTVPTLREAAAAAGRPEAVRVIAGLPVCVTDDPDDARERAADLFAVYGWRPSYRAMLDREGLEGPADLALIGDEQQVAAAVHRVAEAGATDLLAAEFGTAAERTRTRALLASLL